MLGGVVLSLVINRDDYTGNVQAVDTDRFTFNRPAGTGQGNLGGANQIFSVQSRYFIGMGDVSTGSGGTHPYRPVFGTLQPGDPRLINNTTPELFMNEILWQTPFIPDSRQPLAPANVYNYGLVVLNDLATADNLVMIELADLNGHSPNAAEMWFTFTDLYGNTSINNIETAGFTNMPGSSMAVLRQNAVNSLNRGSFVHSTNAGLSSFVGAFYEEGYYNFHMRINTALGWRNLRFAFYVINASNYVRTPSISYVAPNDINGRPMPTYNTPVRQRGDSNQFFFNFNGRTPFTQFDPRRFDVAVTATNFQQIPVLAPAREGVVVGLENLDRFTFEMLGNYTVQSGMVFEMFCPQAGNGFGGFIRLPVMHFSGYRYTLHIFGYQAYFEEFDNQGRSSPEWFGGREDADNNLVNADISKDLVQHLQNISPIHAHLVEAGTRTGADTFQTFMHTIAHNFTPAETNQPPVHLAGNAILAREFLGIVQGVRQYGAELSTVSFRPNSNAPWNVIDFNPNRPFFAPGEYIVTLYYNFSIADLLRVEPYRQVFYFRIVDLMDVRIAKEASAGVYEIYHINEFIDRRVPVNNAFFVFMDGMNASAELSPFSRLPRISLRITCFAGSLIANYNNIDLTDIALQANLFNGTIEGNFEFRIFSGNLEAAQSVFSVIVDNSLVDTFATVGFGGHGENRFYTPDQQFIAPDAPSNVAIWGAGNIQNFGVELSWDAKPSGVAFRHAAVEFYAFENQSTSATFISAIGNTLPDAQNIVSPYVMSTTPTRMNFNINSTADGRFVLNATFRATGLYIIRIYDRAGNESVFVLIIDNTLQGFSQDPTFDFAQSINMVTDRSGVQVGFGENKVIPASINTIRVHDEKDDTSTLLDLLGGTSLFNNGFVIPIATAYISTNLAEQSFRRVYNMELPLGDHLYLDSPIYEEITVPANVNHHFVQITREDYYIFRSRDVFGNTSFYYVFLNFDNSHGTVLEDDVPLTYLGGGNLTQSASIVRPGGISNREFLTFSFRQAGMNDAAIFGQLPPYVVESVELMFFPKTHQRYTTEVVVVNPEDENCDEVIITQVPNPNYPFAAEGIQLPDLFQVEFDGMMQPILTPNEEFIYRAINHVPSTPSGIYMITRRYYANSLPITSDDSLIRNYFVIVDRNPIIAPVGVFESGIEIEFGNRIATYEHFQKENNTHMVVGSDVVLGSNTTGLLRLPSYGTKYGNTNVLNIPHQVIDEFGNEVTNSHFTFFSLLLNTEISFLPTGANPDNTAEWQVLSHNARNLTGNGIYRLGFTDGSGGMRWQLFGMGERVIQPNRSEILVEIDLSGPRGDFLRNGRRVTSGTTINNPGGGRTWHGSTQLVAGDSLVFTYTREDDNNFFARVDQSSITRTSPLWPPVVSESVQGSAIVREYVITNAQEGETFRILLRSFNATVPDSIFYLTIDNTPPSFNLGRVQAVDNLWGSAITQANILPNRYIYSIPNNFMFIQPSANALLESAHMTFFEVNQSLLPIDGGGERVLPHNIPFATVVGLGDYENRFFSIVEMDQAGNRTQFFVQLRGQYFHDDIHALGIRGTTNIMGFGPHYGIDIVVTNADQFFLDNPFFEISQGSNIFRRIAANAIVNGVPVENVRPHDLVVALNTWLRHAHNREAEIPFTVTNGFVTREITVFQITTNTTRPVLSAVPDHALGNLLVSIANIQHLPTLFGGAIPMHFQIRDLVTGVVTTEPVFGAAINIVGAANRELLITLIDAFGRQSFVEHNGIYGSQFGFNYYGNTRIVNGIRHAGDERGVSMSLTTNVHEILVSRNGILVYQNNGWHVLPNNMAREIDGNLSLYTIIPPEDEAISRWQVVIRSHASGQVVVLEDFVFYTNLPTLNFTNLNGDCVLDQIQPGQGLGTISGIVQVSFNPRDSIFASSVNFTRTFFNPNFNPNEMENDFINPRFVTEQNSVRRGQTRFNLTLPGLYVIEIVNEVWARHTVEFEITDVDNIVYKVFFHYENPDFDPTQLPSIVNQERIETQLAPSPEPFVLPDDFDYINARGRNVPIYFVRGVHADINTLSGHFEIRPSINYPRIPYGQGPNDFYQKLVVDNVATYIYALRSDLTDSLLFFAVAAISENDVAWDNANQRVSDAGIQVSLVPVISYEATPVIHIHTFLPVGGVVVSLLPPGGFAGQTFSGHPQNVFYVDYFVNDIHTGTFMLGETFTIFPQNYGVFRFVVRDHAGFIRTFTDVPAGISRDYFTIVNLTRPPILINGYEVIDGMVYNHEIVLSLVDIPLTLRPLFLRSIDVTLDGVRHDEHQFIATSPHSITEWRFTEPGIYRFNIAYSLDPQTTITKQFTIQLAMAHFPGQPNFSFTPPANVDILEIRHHGRDVTENFAGDSTITLDHRVEAGLYTFTIRIGADNVRQERIKTFMVEVRPVPGFGQHVQVVGVDWGSSTTGSAFIWLNAVQVIHLFGDTTLFVETFDPDTGRWENKFEPIRINYQTLHNVVEQDADSFPTDWIMRTIVDEGRYRVRLEHVNGYILFSDGFAITTGLNAVAVMFIILIGAALVVGTILFITLRNRMKVR